MHRKLESKKKRLGQLEEQLQKLEVQATDKVSVSFIGELLFNGEGHFSILYNTLVYKRTHLLHHTQQENKEIALGTSKLNYLDPRISVAWCRKWDVPVEKIYNKTQREKFAWAIDMADEDFVF